MLAAIARSAARSLFTVGILFGFAALLAVYGAYRLLRFVTVGAPPQPRQRAAFDALMAIVALARAMKIQPPAGVSLEQELATFAEQAFTEEAEPA